jgi:hypothetical protein
MHTEPETNNFSQELTARSRDETLTATVENVRHTCEELTDSAECLVRIDEQHAISFIEELDLESVKRSSHYMEVPIEFLDVQSEVNFHVTLHLFNFGHGYRHALHKACGVGAWQTMKRGIEALHATSARGSIDAITLLNLSENNVDKLFHFPPQGSSNAADQIDPLRKMILGVAHSTGRRLLELGYQTFAEFFTDHTKITASGQPSGLKLVEALADNFPPFDDRRALPGGKEVLFLKKAQIAIAELYQRLGDAHIEQFAFGDIKNLTVACDNVLPCVLRILGILKLSPELERKIDAREPLLAGLEEAQLRAAAITAAEMILERANGAFWAKELGDYLWTLGKDPKFRQIERHATLDTCYY